MGKEEILKNNTDSFEADTRLKSDVLEAMQEFADQEKEKVAVAFAEWKDNNVFGFGYYSISNSREYMFFESISDLYQYFIENVYNK